MPQINTIAQDYAAKGVKGLGLNYMESLSTVQTYQNWYPNILMLRDSSGSVYSSYRQNGYIPLNYVIDHDMDQTVRYWMEGYNNTTIKNQIENNLADVTANMDPAATSFQRGTQCVFDIEVTNWMNSNRTVYMLLDVELPSGGYRSLGPTQQLNLTALQVMLDPHAHNIPMAAPLGSYRMRVRLGMPPADLWNADYFDFEVTP